MGCCFSTNKPPPSPEFHRHSSKSSRAPPPVDEETVKEVLSETHNRNHHFLKIEHGSTKITTPGSSLHKIQHQQNNNNLDDINLSEICSTMSENISTTTFEEENEIIRRRVTDRSPAKLRTSPVRSKQQSPGRVRSEFEINNRGSGFGSTSRQRTVSRSRSPANRTAVSGGGGAAGVTVPASSPAISPSSRRRTLLPPPSSSAVASPHPPPSLVGAASVLSGRLLPSAVSHSP